MSASPPFPLPAHQKHARPFPSWPVWLLFGVMLLPSLAGVWLLGGVKDSSAEVLDTQRDLVSRNVVLTGTLTDVDTTSGMPKTSSSYAVVVPDADGGPDRIVTFSGGEQWGFPPSSEYPSQLSFLVVTDDPTRAIKHGPVGSIRPVTAETVHAAERDLASAQLWWIAGIVVFWIFAAGLPALAIVLGVRRHRAKNGAALRI